MDFPDLPNSGPLRAAVGALVAFACLGLYALWDAFYWWAALAAVAIVVLLAWPQGLRILARFAVAALLAILALAGFDVLAGWLGVRVSIPVGLVVAVVVAGLAAYWYLTGAGWKRGWTALAAGGLAAVLVFGVPVLFALSKGSGGKGVPRPEQIGSRLDALIVTDGSRQPTPAEVPPADPSLSGFDVSYSVGFAVGNEVRWTLSGCPSAGEALRAAAEGNEPVRTPRDACERLPGVEGPPALRQGADSVLLLEIDGTDPVTAKPEELRSLPGRPGEIQRWQAVAAGFPGVPAFALLQTTRPGRLARWQSFATPGGAVSAQALGSLTATDAAVRLAVAAPTSQADYALALAHQPLLLFDRAEPVPRPLSVATLFEEGRVRLCKDLGITGSDCAEDPLASARELESGGTHLKLDLPGSAALRRTALREKALIEGAPEPVLEEGTPGAAPLQAPRPGAELTEAPVKPGTGSAIYVHPVSSELEGRRLLYLDYWWYLPDNPSDVGGGALCGAGLVIAGVTCNTHQSDWEGITVVVDRSGPKPFVTAVQYAQHDVVERYGWSLLNARWNASKRLAAMTAAAPGRPLAFVAKGSHATYPVPCSRDCHELAASIGEGKHRGDLPWIGNVTGTCGEDSCLQVLPTREAGRQPALWNAFAGAWGDVDCFFTYYCDSGTPPSAPGHQDRYGRPTYYDGVADSSLRPLRRAFEAE